MEPAIFYKERLIQLEAALKKLEQRNAALGWARFISGVFFIPLIYFLWPFGMLYVLPASLILLIVFVKIIFIDLDNKTNIRHHEQLITITQNEIKALNGDYYHFYNGNEYIPHEHLYANDVDIFGNASLFQYINRTTSAIGSASLANWLLYPANTATITDRQTAVKELATQTVWRQSLQAYGNEKKIERSTYQRLQEWINEEYSFIHNRMWIVLQWLVPSIMLLIVGLNIADIIPDATRNWLLLASAVLAFYISKRVVPLHTKVSKITDELSILSESIRLIEDQPFNTALLTEFQSAYKQSQTTASGEMKKLKAIVQRLDWRLNPVVFVPLAILFQWDLHQVIALEKWKKKNHDSIQKWFEALGNFEAISSLATLYFNHPHWSFPELKKEHFFIEGKNVGHPLINANKRVNNNIEINDKGIVMIVTGSNMAGKSTYLRSVGINVVLTMAGAVCCADHFSLSPVQLITSMRIADNLEENTSTFYAELKKLKTIIDKVNAHEKVFILLDEILRGTNSLDRHTGSVALTKQLIKQKAAAIIATHDVELAKLKEEYAAHILNYHFDAQVSQGELFFDYKLKDGICTSLNASLLMKKIGIEL